MHSAHRVCIGCINADFSSTVIAELPRSSSQLSGLLAGRSKPSKQELKERERESQDTAVDQLYDRHRVPLETLVRKSSPIAMVKKDEPAEPQVGVAVCPLCQILTQELVSTVLVLACQGVGAVEWWGCQVKKLLCMQSSAMASSDVGQAAIL